MIYIIIRLGLLFLNFIYLFFKLLPAFLQTAEYPVRVCGVIHIVMRRRDNVRDALLYIHFNQLNGFFYGTGAVIDPVNNVGVNVKHISMISYPIPFSY